MSLPTRKGFILQTKINKDDEELVKDVPPELSDIVNNYLIEENNKLQTKRLNLIKKSLKKKTAYVKEFLDLYTKLMEVLMECVEMGISFEYEYKYSYDGLLPVGEDAEPTDEYWSRKHPGRVAAIEKFMKDLRDKGWEPFQYINEEKRIVEIRCYFD